MDGEELFASPQPERREQAGDPKYMVEMRVREEQAMKPPQAGAAAQQLALRAFSAVDQNSVAACLHK